MMVSSQVIPLIISFSKKSMNFSFTKRISVQSLPNFDPAIIPNIYRHISEFLVFVITVFINLSRISGFMPMCISSDFEERRTFLQNLRRVGSQDFIAFYIILKKSQGIRCYTFLSLAARLIARARSSTAPMLGCGKRINFTTQSIQLVYASVYLIAAYVESKYSIFRAVILLGES